MDHHIERELVTEASDRHMGANNELVVSTSAL